MKYFPSWTMTWSILFVVVEWSQTSSNLKWLYRFSRQIDVLGRIKHIRFFFLILFLLLFYHNLEQGLSSSRCILRELLNTEMEKNTASVMPLSIIINLSYRTQKKLEKSNSPQTTGEFAIIRLSSKQMATPPSVLAKRLYKGLTYLHWSRGLGSHYHLYCQCTPPL